MVEMLRRLSFLFSLFFHFFSVLAIRRTMMDGIIITEQKGKK